MTVQDIGLFQAMGAKMSYLSQREKVIAQNVANADTPGFIPHDLTPVDFSALLGKVGSSGGGGALQPAATDPAHMSGAKDAANPKDRAQKLVYEVAPDGNAVILEEQMLKSAQTMMDYNLVATLYQKNVAMLRMALGR